MSSGERVRYLEILHYHDQQSGMLELLAKQTVVKLESFGFSSDDSYLEEFGEYLPPYTGERIERYGSCFIPFEMPFL